MLTPLFLTSSFFFTFLGTVRFVHKGKHFFVPLLLLQLYYCNWCKIKFFEDGNERINTRKIIMTLIILIDPFNSPEIDIFNQRLQFISDLLMIGNKFIFYLG